MSEWNNDKKTVAVALYVGQIVLGQIRLKSGLVKSLLRNDSVAMNCHFSSKQILLSTRQTAAD